MSALDEHLKKHRRKIIDREEKTFRDMLSAYSEIEKELKKTFDELQRKMEDAQAAGEEISASWVFKESRLKNLLAQVQQQIVGFGGKATAIVEREQRAAIKIAVEQAQENYQFAVADAPDAANFAAALDTRSVETAVGIMGDGSPLAEYFEQQLAPAVAEKIKTEVIKASALGTDFKTISKRLQDAGGITKHRALSFARTEVNRVRRETLRDIYKENDDLISGWEWCASKSSRCCILCLAMDGKIFPLSKPFPQHVNCRCTLLSVLKDLKRRPRTIGKDWFESQPGETKESVLGKEAFLAYQQNGLTLDDFVAFRKDKRFGESVTRRPLAKILADKQLVPKSKPMRDNFLTTDDPAREKYGAAKDSHPKETERIFNALRKEGVDIDQSRPMMAYSPAANRPGRFIIDPNASISALRHEYKHFLDDKKEGYPGLKFYREDDERFWRMEFWAYAEELKFAHAQKDYDLGRKIVKLMRERKAEIFGER